MSLIRPEQAHSINGVPGRLHNLRVPPAPWVAGVFANQTWVSEARSVDAKEWGKGARMTVTMRFDDQCRNGHMTFSITADIRSARGEEAGGCLHDEIRRYFPELAAFIQWHGISTDGPTHYIANTCFLAGDRDYNGREKGEPCAWEYAFRFGTVPALHIVKESLFKWINARLGEGGEFLVQSIAHQNRVSDTYKFKPKWTFVGYGEHWHDCPFDSEAEASAFAASLNTCTTHPERIATDFAEGKARELEAARRAANWPEATDEELSVPRLELERVLKARLPGLLERFEAAMTGAGFLYRAPLAETV